MLTEKEVDLYLDVYSHIRKAVATADEAIAVFQVFFKDRREGEFRPADKLFDEQRRNKPATIKQIAFLTKNNIPFNESISKYEAHLLIEAKIGDKK